VKIIISSYWVEVIIMESKVKYGKELGPNLRKIALRLAKNEELCKLLINTDLDPLNKDKHPEKIDWK
jgi:hypothetical protein